MLLSRNGVLKICDFGSAKLFQQNTPLTEYMSTRWYRAPELLIIHNQYNQKIDVWAIGCIFCELLTGKALFTGKNEYDMLRLILKMFHEDQVLPSQLTDHFYQKNLFTSVKLPV